MSGTIYLLKEQDKVKEDITPMTDGGYDLFVERKGRGQSGYKSND